MPFSSFALSSVSTYLFVLFVDPNISFTYFFLNSIHLHVSVQCSKFTDAFFICVIVQVISRYRATDIIIVATLHSRFIARLLLAKLFIFVINNHIHKTSLKSFFFISRRRKISIELPAFRRFQFNIIANDL